MELECDLYCEIDPNAQGFAPHHYTKIAQSYGARVHLCANLEAAKIAAEQQVKEEPDLMNIPLGFDCIEFNFHYRKALESQWRHVKRVVPKVNTIWLPVGSGTLLRSFAAVLSGSDVQIKGVNVHVLKKDDLRIAGLTRISNVSLFSSPLKFTESSSQLPPFPSNVHYDAKIAEFVTKYGKNGDVWWNVAH
jgi:hypothetical protein